MYKINSILRFLALGVVIILLSSKTSNSQYFLKSYDLPAYGTRTEIGKSLEQSGISNWVIAGYTNSMPSPGGYNWLCQKVNNTTGAPVCTSILGFPADDSCFSNIVMTGSLRNVLSGFYKPMADLREKASFSLIDSNCIHILSRMIMDSLRHQYRSVTKDPGNVFTNAGWIQTYMTAGVTPDKILASQYTPAGALVWAFRYLTGAPSVEQGYSICFQPTDGTYAITGITNFFTGGATMQAFILKVTAGGFPIWFKAYSIAPGTTSQARKIIPMTDGGFVVAGFSNAFDPGFNDAWVFRVTSMGTPIWSNTYGLPGFSEEGHSIVYQASDASLIFTGFNSTATENITYTKISAAGGIVGWTRHFPNPAGSDRGYDIELYMPAVGITEYALTGQVYAPASTSLDHFLLRSNSLGRIPAAGCLDSIVYQHRPAQVRLDSGMVQCTPLQDITILPQVLYPTPMVRDLCALTGVTGNSTTAAEFELKQNYPNPFNPSTSIEFSLPTDGNVSIKVFDMTGKEVSSLIDGFKNKGVYSITFDASGLSSGIYFYELKTENFTATKKMMLIK